MDNKIQIEVAFATPERQKIVTCKVEPETSVFDGAKHSGIDQIFPEIDFDSVDMGIFGKRVKNPKGVSLQDGDRIEIYRALLIDPKQARLNRAAKNS